MHHHFFKSYKVEIFLDEDYVSGSADNINSYSREYIVSKDAHLYKSDNYGVKVYNHELQINSCVLLACRGLSGVHDTSSIIDKDNLIMCCNDTICCLSIPELELVWHTNADFITCFQVFKLNDDYIIHGEMDITRIDKKGDIKWQFSGADIFVSMDNRPAFKINPDHIYLKDFNNLEYKIDFNGKLLDK